jgi:hypothetical protein
MMSRRDYNRPVPEPPGHDPANPAHVRSATVAGKIRATNENKSRRRRYEKEVARFSRVAARHASEQLFDAFDLTPPEEPARVEPYSAEFMLDQRRRARESMAVFMREMHEMNMAHARKWLCEIYEIAGPQEFDRIMRDVLAAQFPGVTQRIYGALCKVKLRRETPFTEQMEIVLAVLEANEGEPPTVCELHRGAGDGMTRAEVQQTVWTLASLDLVKISLGRRCAHCDIPGEATWRATNVERREGE